MTNKELIADVHPSERREYGDILARLLGEYTSKLKGNIEKLERMQLHFQLVCTVIFGVLCTISFETLFVQITKYSIRKVLEKTISLDGIVGDVFAVVVAVFVIRFCNNYAVKRNMLVLDIRSSIEQTSKLIRYSSQIQEVGITDFVTRLELDFKTTDAEETLRLAQGIVKSPKLSSSRSVVATKESRTPAGPELVWEEPVRKTGAK